MLARLMLKAILTDTRTEETQMEPVHGAEALGFLAGIELSMTEVLYVEKMEELSVEEAMILHCM